MAKANLPLGEEQFLEILDEEFNNHLTVARTVMRTLKRSKDREICAKFIRKCLRLDAPNIQVKSNRNEFFRYFLKMLSTASSRQPPQYDNWYKPRKKEGKEKTSSFWSVDKRTYVACKAIPGYATLVYIAVSYRPDFGWQKTGFSSYEF